ncbi:hypothetical protein D3C72_2319320 [compost metagenome]
MVARRLVDIAATYILGKKAAFVTFELRVQEIRPVGLGDIRSGCRPGVFLTRIPCADRFALRGVRDLQAPARKSTHHRLGTQVLRRIVPRCRKLDLQISHKA